MKNPFKQSPSGPPPDENEWMRYVCDSHLELLMILSDRNRDGEPLTGQDAAQYKAVRKQAEMFKAQAKAENWSDELLRQRMCDKWWVTRNDDD